jgi:hypothetical protein
MYRRLDLEVYQAEQRLSVVTAAATRDANTSVADVARAHGCSPAQVYKLLRKTRDALRPVRPGPKRAPVAVAVTVPTATAPAPCGEPRALLAVLTSQHVSVRGTQQVFAALHLPVPSRQHVVEARRAMGRAARRLLARAREQVRPRLTCLAGDDIFFHRSAVKVLLEPDSGAVLDVMRWPWREAEDWRLWIEDWPALRLFVSDLGTDLTGAARRARIVHQADLFHERKWWHEQVFMPLSRREQKAAAAALRALDRATRVDGPGRRLGPEAVARAEAARARAEEEFFAAVRAEDLLRTLFEPLDPRGARWSDEALEDVLAAVCEHLVRVSQDVSLAAWMHVHTHRARWCAHRVLWESIEVELAPDSAWTRDDVLNALIELHTTERRLREATEWATARAAQVRLATLRDELAAACRNAKHVERAVRSLLSRPRRSSSLVEAFNSALRVLQMKHRNVSDDLMSLHALAWNLRVRKEGRRRGRSPFERLGVEFASDHRPWYEVLIEEMDQP